MSTTPNTVPTIALHDDVVIPQLGLGTYQIPPEDTMSVTLQATSGSTRAPCAASTRSTGVNVRARTPTTSSATEVNIGASVGAHAIIVSVTRCVTRPVHTVWTGR